MMVPSKITHPVSVPLTGWGVTISLDPGISISHLNNREKTNIADALRQTYPLTELLHVLGLARSSYFYHRAALKAGDKYATIRTMLTDIVNSNYQCYGYRRLHAMLRHEGGQLSEKVVSRLMVKEQLVVSRNRRRRYSSYCGEIGPDPDNLIARDFKEDQPNQKWLTDITEFQLPAGKSLAVTGGGLLRWKSCELVSQYTPRRRTG